MSAQQYIFNINAIRSRKNKYITFARSTVISSEIETKYSFGLDSLKDCLKQQKLPMKRDTSNGLNGRKIEVQFLKDLKNYLNSLQSFGL